MKLANNTFTRALKQGDKQVGLWVTLSSPFAAPLPPRSLHPQDTTGR